MTVDIPKTYDVFLSYASKDKTWAEAACAVLEQNRIRCWIAPRDITPGDEWGAAIINGIKASRIMVLVFSGHANGSAQVRREVERAISRSLVVLPIRIENIDPEGSMAFAIGNTHWLDAFTPPIENQLRILTHAVKTLLETESSAAKATEPVVPSDAESGTTSKTVEAKGVSPPTAQSRTRWGKRRQFATFAILFTTVAVILGVILTRGREGGENSEKTPVDSNLNTIDLLSRVRLNRQNERSHWEFHEGAIYSTGTEAEFLRLPVRAPSEYRLELTVARIRPGGMSDFTIGVVCGENRCAVLLDGWGGTVSGLSYLDGKVANENATKYTGRVFPQKRSVDIVVTVRRHSILVIADGKTIVNWRGNPSRLSVIPPTPPGSRMLTIGAFGGYFRVDKLTLTPLPDSPIRNVQ